MLYKGVTFGRYIFNMNKARQTDINIYKSGYLNHFEFKRFEN